MYHLSVNKKFLIIMGLILFPFFIVFISSEAAAILSLILWFIGIPVSLVLMLKKPRDKSIPSNLYTLKEINEPNKINASIVDEEKLRIKLDKQAEKEKAKANKEKLKAEKIAYAKEHFNVTSQLKYIGGGDIAYEKYCRVVVTNDFFFYDGHPLRINDIKRTAIETQSQISSRLTATRLLAFGVFALAAPKKTKTVEKYLTVDFDGDVPGTLVFSGPNVTAIVSAIRTAQNYQAEKKKLTTK